MQAVTLKGMSRLDVAAGEYRMWCDVPGHAAAGQVGTLVVKGVTEATASPS